MSRALAHAQDIQEPPRLQLGHGLGTDHAAVGDHAHARDVEAPAQPVDHRDQRRHVGGVARPHLRAHRPAVAVDQHGQDHLPQVRTVILAVAVPAQRLAAGALEVQAGGVHEHQVEPREQVAPMREQPLLHHVLEAAWRERRAAVLLLLRQLLAQPRHRPIEMMQIEPLDAGDRVILTPAIGGAVGAAHEQPVQHGEEHRALQRKLVPALAGEIGDHRAAAGLLPQPLEHQRRPDAADRNLDRGIIAGRAQHHGLGRKPRARAQQPFQLAARLQILETPERRDHLLTHLVALAAALDDLQIGAPGRGLAAKVHGGLRMLVRTQSRDSSRKINKSTKYVALHFRANVTLQQAKSMTYLTSTRPNCRRWAKVPLRRSGGCRFRCARGPSAYPDNDAPSSPIGRPSARIGPSKA